MSKDVKDNPASPQKPGCFVSGLSILLFLSGLHWFIIGEIIIEGKGVHVVGAGARIAAAIWMAVSLFPFWRCLTRRS